MEEPDGAGDEGEEQPDPRQLDTWIRPFFSDSTLWPVLVVAFAIFVVFGAALLLLAVRSRSPWAIAALLVLAWMSVDGVSGDVRRRRLGLVSRSIVTLWTASALAAVVATAAGLY
jgi:hypothetical protein